MNLLPISFQDYVELGVEHIADFAAYDHMLFLLALCAPFTLRNWKKALVLATAFTIGHSITLIAAGLDLFRFNTVWIEFFIPVTILLTALGHWLPSKRLNQRKFFWLCLVFGFIHGMGFSTFIRFVSSKDGFVGNLLAFNLGVELGQILIVVSILLFSSMVLHFSKMKGDNWKKILSGAAILVSLMLIVQNWPSD